MSQDFMNPDGGVSMAEAASAERLVFLRKTYSKLLIGVGIFVTTIMAVHQVEAVNEFARGLWSSHRLIMVVLLLGVGFGVRMVARVPGIGILGYVAYSVFLGMVIGPLTMLASPDATLSAAIMTGVIFVGLTAYVFVTKHDFSWMGGILAIGLFAMIGIALVGYFAGFSIGIWYSVFGALLFSGYILYDTSNVLHRYGPDDSLPAAIELFTDVVYLFWNLLMLLMSRD